MQSSKLRFIGAPEARPESEEDAGEAEGELYEVESIVDRRLTVHGAYEYLVDWRGYGPADRTWESYETLREGCSEMLDDFTLAASAREAARNEQGPPAKRVKVSPEPFKFPSPPPPVASTSKTEPVKESNNIKESKVPSSVDNSPIPLNLCVYKPYTSAAPVEVTLQVRTKQTSFRLDAPKATPSAPPMSKSVSTEKRDPRIIHLRIRFRSQWVVECDFGQTSTIGAIHDAIRSALLPDYQTKPFTLSEKVPGGHKFSSTDQSKVQKKLSTVGLGSKALLHFDFDDSDLNERFQDSPPPLSEYLIKHASDLPETTAGVAPLLLAADFSKESKGKKQKTGIHTLKETRAPPAKKRKKADEEYEESE